MATRKKQPKLGRRAQPLALERSYARDLRKIVKQCRPVIDAAVAKLTSNRNNAAGDDDRNVTEVRRAFGDVGAAFDTIVRRARPGLLAQGVDKRVTAFAIEQADKQMRGVVTVPDSEIVGDHAGFVRENVALIKSIPRKLHQQVQAAVSEAWTSGATTADLTGVVAERFNVTDRRARLIARDQVGKLNAKVVEERHKELGIVAYTWSTSRDERVRGNPGGLYPNADPSHWAREGKRFRYDDPPEGGHPGEPIQCRCEAIPVIPEFDDE